MLVIERLLISLLNLFFTVEQINQFMRDPQAVAIVIGALIALSGALLGTFLLLRGMSLTTDAISHTVLLGVIVMFLITVKLLSMEMDLSSPILIVGAAISGLVTVLLTELIHRSGIVKQDAALGLAFPLLFAIAILLISRYAEDVHIDTDSVMVGEVGIAWADTNSHCLQNCEEVTITVDSEDVIFKSVCTNCVSLQISPHDPEAVFIQECANCGVYSPAMAWHMGFSDIEPVVVFWPKSITTNGFLSLLTVLFVLLLYKELKITTFDEALAKTLGFRPDLIRYALMTMVSLVTVGALDAVGSILVVAFFIIPVASSYLLTDKLYRILLLSPILGTVSVIWGYELARGNFFGFISIQGIILEINQLTGWHLVSDWNTSISASMVLMMFALFFLAWMLSPRMGVISSIIKRRQQSREFGDQVLLGHIYNHEGTPVAAEELKITTMHEHLRWSPARLSKTIQRLKEKKLIIENEASVGLTALGREIVVDFQESMYR